MGFMLTTNKKYTDGVSAIDAALDADALFTPQVTGTILPDGSVDDNTFTVYRTLCDGSQKVLNAGVKRGYHAEGYQSLLNTAEAMFPGSVQSLQAWDDGAILVFTQQITEPYVFGDGDSVTNHVMYTASLNSHFSTAAIGFSFRPFCTNQMGIGTLQIAQKRTKRHDELLFQKATVMAQAAQRFEAFISDATMLKGLAMTPTLKRTILDRVAPLLDEDDAAPKAVNHAQRRRDGIEYFYAEESDTFGHNAYALMQAVQTFEFHEATKGKAQEMKQVRVVTDPDKFQSLTDRTASMLLASV